MNVNQLKTRIFILKAIDTILVLVVIIAAIYTAFYAAEKEFLILGCFIGLFVINTLGRVTGEKIALMRVQMDVLIRKNKKAEQRTIMGTRHTKVRETKSGGSITNPATKNK